MTVPASGNQPKVYTKPPAGAVTKQLPGYTPIRIQPPDKVVDHGGRAGQTRTPQPAYTMYLPPAQNLQSYPSWNGTKITVDQTLFPNAEPVQWTSGGNTVTIGLMFDNKDTGQRNFAYFGNGHNPNAVAGGKLETIKPGMLITKYANDPSYSSTRYGLLDATVAHSGNVPAWQLPIPYQIGGLNIYQSNPFNDPVTKVVQTKKDNDAFGGLAEVAESIIETAPEWLPVIAFPVAVAAGAGAFGALAGSGGAGATAATGAPLATGATGAQSVGGGVAAMLSEAGVAGYAPVSTALGSGFGAASGAGSSALLAGAGVAGYVPGALSGLEGSAPAGSGLSGSTLTPTEQALADIGIQPGSGSPITPATGAEVDAMLAGDAGLGIGGGGGALTPTEQALADIGIQPGSGSPISPATGAEVDAMLAGEAGLGLGESVVGPALAPIDAAKTGVEGILQKLGAGDITGALSQAGGGILDWAVANPDKALSMFGLLTQLASSGGGGGSATPMTAVSQPGKGLPVLPPLARGVRDYPGDITKYGTQEAQPGPGAFDWFSGMPYATAPQPQPQAAGGGPIEGGALSVLPPRMIVGPGGGQDDLVDAKVSPGEYVFDASTVSDLGDGNSEEGVRKLDRMVQQIRRHKRGGRVALPPKAPRSPLDYLT